MWNTDSGGAGGRKAGGLGGGRSQSPSRRPFLDIFDAKTKALIFRGTAEDEISDKAEKNVKKVEKASAKMFKDFPPGSKEKK